MASRSKIDATVLRKALDGPMTIEQRETLSNFLQREAIFKRPFGRLKTAEARRLTNLRNVKRFQAFGNGFEDRLQQAVRLVLKNADAPEAEELLVFMNYALTFGAVDFSASIAFSLAWVLPVSIIKVLGTEEHEKLIDKVYSGELLCCLMMTELAHGTNVREICTTASFDVDNQQFVFNTPNVGGVKCWSGNLAGVANHAILFAQLCLAGRKCGVQPFLVQLRHLDTHELLPGVVVGDMGEKVGMHGVANGWAVLHNFRQPRHALLNRFVDVNEQGEIVSFAPGNTNETNSQCFSLVLLGAFGDGRVGLTAYAIGSMITATTIALRYSHARKQFPVLHPQDNQPSELPIIEFQLQQCRLIPHLARAHCWYYYLKVIYTDYLVFRIRLMNGDITFAEADLIREIHALSCASKALSGWLAMQAIQEAREACGGHGYLHASRFGQLRNDLDVNLTWEGDNNVLLLQTGAYLLSVHQKRLAQSPLHSIDFIGRFDFSLFERGVAGLRSSTVAEQFTLDNILDDSSDKGFLIEILQYSTCHRLWKYANKTKALVESGLPEHEARLQTQAFYSKDVAVDYIETYVLMCFYDYVYNRNDRIHYGILRLHSQESVDALRRLLTLYACSAIEERLSGLCECGLAAPTWPTTCHEAIIALCSALKVDCLPLIDAIAPSDFIIDSVLAHSDSNTMYSKLFDSLLASSGDLDPNSIPFQSKL